MNEGDTTQQSSTENVSTADSGAQTQTAPVEKTEGTAKPETPSEKLLKQSEVNEIVGGVKKEAYEKGRRDSLGEVQAKQTQELKNDVTPQQAETNAVNAQLSEENIRQIIDDESQRKANEAVIQNVVNEFVQKMSAGKDKHSDFNEVVEKLNIPSIPHIVVMANSMDNTADVMYELGKHPAKLANVLMLAQNAPRLAQDEFRKLSESIKKNEEAAGKEQPPEPLDQIKPSITGTDNGSMTVNDLRKQPWLRG